MVGGTQAAICTYLATVYTTLGIRARPPGLPGLWGALNAPGTVTGLRSIRTRMLAMLFNGLCMILACESKIFN